MNKSLFALLLIFICAGCNTSTSGEDGNIIITTKYGEMRFELFGETPNHRKMFISLAKSEHFNQFTFNRVIKDFVIQGGCPDSTKYFENSPYLVQPEFSDSIKHRYGALGMGRDDNPEKQSNGCQFYIVSNENGLPRLDGEYMIFGQLVKGFEVLEKIESVATDSTDTPLESIPLEVSVIDQ